MALAFGGDGVSPDDLQQSHVQIHQKLIGVFGVIAEGVSELFWSHYWDLKLYAKC